MRTLRKNIASRVLGEAARAKVELNIALAVPTVRQLRSALNAKGAAKTLPVTIVHPLTLNAATLSRQGAVTITGKVEVEQLEVSIEQLTTRKDGGYSFIGVRYTTYTWEYNYNAGYGMSETWTTYEFTVDANGNAASYKQLDSRTSER